MIALSTTPHVINAHVVCNLSAFPEPSRPRTLDMAVARYPTLQARNGNRSPLVRKRQKRRRSRPQLVVDVHAVTPAVSPYKCGPSPLVQFKKRPYVAFAKITGFGFIRSSEDETAIQLPAAIKTLCVDFYYDETIGVDQIGFVLYKLLKKTKQASIVKSTASQLIQRYLSLTNAAEADGYFDALVQQKCFVSNAITDCSSDSKYLTELGRSRLTVSSYHISREKEFEFSRIRKGKK